MKGTKHQRIGTDISDEDWKVIFGAFENSAHDYVLEALKKSGNNPVQVESLVGKGQSATNSPRWNINRINAKFIRLNIPFTIGMVEQFRSTPRRSGSFRMWKIKLENPQQKTPEAPTTARLQIINPASYSVLPTGRLKVERTKLFQEAEILVHRPSTIETSDGLKNFPQGVHLVWFSVPTDFVQKLR